MNEICIQFDIFLQDGDPHYEHKHNVTAKGFGGGSSAPTQPAQPPGENIFEMHSPKQLSRYHRHTPAERKLVFWSEP